jgi:two-component system response regulator FixJ
MRVVNSLQHQLKIAPFRSEDSDGVLSTTFTGRPLFGGGFNAVSTERLDVAVNQDHAAPQVLARGRSLGNLRELPVRRALHSDAVPDRRQAWACPGAVFETSDNDDPATGARGLVQLVDKDTTSLRLTTWALEAAGYRVRAQASGAAVLAAVNHERPCCVLLGMDTQDLSGLDVQAELKRRGVAWPVIMTGRSKIDGVVRAMKNGALDFLETPVESSRLLEAVEAGFLKVEQVRQQSERAARAGALIDRLTARERQVMTGLLAGLPNKLIAHQLALSVRTVEIYRATVMSKLQVRSVPCIVRLAIDAGLEPLTED